MAGAWLLKLPSVYRKATFLVYQQGILLLPSPIYPLLSPALYRKNINE